MLAFVFSCEVYCWRIEVKLKLYISKGQPPSTIHRQPHPLRQEPVDAFQRRMNGICCYDGARQAVARFGRAVAMETARRAKSSCRQSADAHWGNYNSFLASLFISCIFSAEEAFRGFINCLRHFASWECMRVYNCRITLYTHLYV